MEVVFTVALLAAVQVWRSRELCRVHILVAIGASIELDPEDSRTTRWSMTLGALNVGVPATQGEASCAMVLHRKDRALESVDGMTAFAFSAVGSLHELTVVRIWLVTVGAKLMRELRLEVARLVTSGTTHVRVLAPKGISRLVVIKRRQECCLLPGDTVVATATILLEFSAMNIDVA